MPVPVVPTTPQASSPSAPSAPAASAAGGVRGADVVATAMTQLGKPYEFGSGPSTATFDCSDLVQWAYKQHGIRLPRVTGDQVKIGSSVPRAQIQPGDLIFSNWIGREHSHVGLYVGDGTLIQAPKTGDVVKITKLGPSYWSHVDAIRRPAGVIGGPASNPPAGASGTDPAGLIAGLLGPINRVLNPAEAATAALAPLRVMAESAASVAGVANRINQAFLPTNIMRGVAGLAGGVFLLIGVIFLAREVKR